MSQTGFSSKSIGTVSGVFFSKRDADNAFNYLIDMGHTPDDISILMSDETLPKDQKAIGQPLKESALSKATSVFAGAIISFTSIISLPKLGVSISNTLKKMHRMIEKDNVSDRDENPSARVQDQQLSSLEGEMQEGGIIVSVDPRNADEKKAIIANFRLNHGTDILGDDGYTELY
jgi:hypothetical protein